MLSIRNIFALLALLLAGLAQAQTLSPAQQQTLKAAINGNPTWAAYPTDGDGPTDLAAALNVTAVPTFTVWRTDCRVADIHDAIDYSKYTPTATISGSEAEPTLTRKIGWVLETQVKQMNLQLLLQGRDTINTSKVNVRAALRDAVIQVPTGALDGNGKPSLTAPGGSSGATALVACTRPATEAEKVLATASQGSDTTGSTTARVMGWEGRLSAGDVLSARSLP